MIINTDTSVDLTSATLNSVEALQLNRGELILNADQWNEFKTITARGDNSKKVIVGESEGIDLSKFQRLADSNTTLEIGLTADPYIRWRSYEWEDIFHNMHLLHAL